MTDKLKIILILITHDKIKSRACQGKHMFLARHRFSFVIGYSHDFDNILIIYALKREWRIISLETGVNYAQDQELQLFSFTYTSYKCQVLIIAISFSLLK